MAKKNDWHATVNVYDRESDYSIAWQGGPVKVEEVPGGMVRLTTEDADRRFALLVPRFVLDMLGATEPEEPLRKSPHNPCGADGGCIQPDMCERLTACGWPRDDAEEFEDNGEEFG